MVSWNKVFENFDKRLDHEDIDELRSLINSSTERRINKLKKEYDNINERTFDSDEHAFDIDGYKDHLVDLMINASNIKSLSDELSILALFKSVEVKISKVIDKKFYNNGKKRFIGKLKLITRHEEVETLAGYDAYNELRLINNAIKHEGMVSNELATAYSSWIEDEELKDIDTAYNRLLPQVKYFVQETVSKAYELSAV
ncbi:hypothetical protein [Citrobacter sedlakii]|uniref:hypothetical protein n=1 Tax=Citrobacter sedlakii TaxID=67826 RepID=UPI003363C5E3|nr:hypothetical protein [Citrobacter sedlakii]